MQLSVNSEITSEITREEFRELAGAFPTGVAAVTTTGSQGQPAGLTTNAFVSVSMVPPLFAVFVGTGSRTLQWLKTNDYFAINFLNGDAETVARTFASNSEDKFSSLRWSQGFEGIPLLHDDSLAIAECLKRDVLPLGDHIMVLGEVVRSHALKGMDPLLYYRRVFSSVPTVAETT